MGTDEIASLTDRILRQPHRLVVIASDELSIGRNAHIDRREWIARAQTKRAADRPVGLLAPAAYDSARP